MTKRSRDTEMWGQPWHLKLDPIQKCFWAYVLDNCDLAGVWSVDFLDLAAIMIGGTIDLDATLAALSEQIEVLSEKTIFVRGFVRFHFGSGPRKSLSPKTPIHQSVWRAIKGHGIESHPAFAGLTDAMIEHDEEKGLDPPRPWPPDGAPVACAAPKPKAKATAPAKATKAKADPLDATPEKPKALEPVDWIKDLWNATVSPPTPECLRWTAKRRTAARARLVDYPGRAAWELAIKKIAASAFCKGDNARGWKASLDFLLKPDSMDKVLEGHYDGKGGVETGGTTTAGDLVQTTALDGEDIARAEKVMAALREFIDADLFDQWRKDLRLVRDQGRDLCVHCPSRESGTVIKRQYGDAIKQAIDEAFSIDWEPAFLAP